MLTFDTFIKKVGDGHYSSETNARRAVGQTKFNKRQKGQALAAVATHFKKGSQTAPKRVTRRASNGQKLRGAVFGENDVKLDGVGDCSAVALVEAALDEGTRDKINRLLSLAREENVTLPILSARFARVCTLVNRL